MLDRLFLEMIAYYSGDPKRIGHFTKVHSYAKLIGEQEGLSAEELFILEAAAYTHDIGIKPAEEKYGSCAGKLQEEEGPAVAREMLGRLGFDAKVTERVCYLIGHHHTYSNIDGIDYQILVEADFLVNLYEDGTPDGKGGFLPDEKAVRTAYERIFWTETGKRICAQMFWGNAAQAESIDTEMR
ncbi:MAG: HD domain-containing protein [Roseburia sp.]|nr:HD domain-containing protein [Roseburia sp.]